jgi:L-ascorbate metabolism protein UlaG (beta-lactamase superfamily)
MKIRRTANAGVLLELDGVSILMDGVCREVKPYPATPPEERDALQRSFPDVIAFTHAHKDHYDPAFAALYQKQTSGVILGPATLPGCKATMEDTVVKGVYILPVSSRHIGLAGKDVEHASFIVQGSRCVWFLGDAAPMQWRGKDLPKPDVLIVPYAYANTPSGWSLTRSLGADHVVLLHMPKREEDTIGLWDAVNAVLKCEEKQPAILSMSETIEI